MPITMLTHKGETKNTDRLELINQVQIIWKHIPRNQITHNNETKNQMWSLKPRAFQWVHIGHAKQFNIEFNTWLQLYKQRPSKAQAKPVT